MGQRFTPVPNHGATIRPQVIAQKPVLHAQWPTPSGH